MPTLILSDIHADIRALERVLALAAAEGWDRLVVLGDAVGYGPEPEAVVQRLMALAPRVALQGNHEAMVLAAARGEPPSGGRAVREVILRHARTLSPASLAFLGALPRQHLDHGWGAVHGALRSPWEYLISGPAARANAPHMQRPLYFVGHTHVPSAFVLPSGATRWQSRGFRGRESRLPLGAGDRAFLNPGAVSLPRDGLPGPSYALFDEEAREFRVFRPG